MTLAEPNVMVPPAIARSADHFYTYEGERYPGVTGILGVLDKSGPLMGWAAKMTAEAAVESLPHLSQMLDTVGPAGVITFLTARRNWKLDEARDLGTDVHSMAELVVKGEPTPAMAEPTRKRVLHYAEWWKNSGWTLRLAEAMVVFPTHKYGGTFDLLAYDRDGRTVLADIKTGKGVYREVALQLAAYSLAPIVAPSGSPVAYPMPKVDRHVVIHVTQDGVREVEISVGTAEHMAWLACIDLHAWSESMKGEEILMPITGTAYTPSVAPGIHQAVITNIEDVESKTDPGQYFRGWEFTLADGTGKTVRASSSLATSPKSKGGKWIAALIGHPLAEGETVELVGMACTIVVGLKENGYETVETVAAPDKGNKPKGHAPVAETVAQDEAPTDELPF